MNLTDCYFNNLLDDYLARGHELDKKCKCSECHALFRLGDRYEAKTFPESKESTFCSPRCFIRWYEAQDNDISDYQDMLHET